MAKDPYKYFRVEAREAARWAGAGHPAASRRTPRRPRSWPACCAWRTRSKAPPAWSKQPGIGELAHTVEGILTTHREAGQPLSKEQGSELLASWTRSPRVFRPSKPASDVAVAGPARPRPRSHSKPCGSRFREMDSLLRAVTEAGVQLGAVRKGLGAADRLRDLASLLVGSARRASR